MARSKNAWSGSGRIRSSSHAFRRCRTPPGLPAKIRVRKYLEEEDAAFIEESSPAVSYATVFANRINFNEQTDEIRYGDAHVERFFLRGVQPAYINAFPLFAVAEGRFISAFDEEHARSVVVIGRAIADSLFPSVDPLGKPVRLDGRLYEVVGVFEPDQGLVFELWGGPVRLHSHEQFPEELSGDSRALHRRGRQGRVFSRYGERASGRSDAAKAPCAPSTRKTISRSHRPTFSARCGINLPAQWSCSPASSAASDCWWAVSA